MLILKFEGVIFEILRYREYGYKGRKRFFKNKKEYKYNVAVQLIRLFVNLLLSGKLLDVILERFDLNCIDVKNGFYLLSKIK